MASTIALMLTPVIFHRSQPEPTLVIDSNGDAYMVAVAGMPTTMKDKMLKIPLMVH